MATHGRCRSDDLSPGDLNTTKTGAGESERRVGRERRGQGGWRPTRPLSLVLYVIGCSDGDCELFAPACSGCWRTRPPAQRVPVDSWAARCRTREDGQGWKCRKTGCRDGAGRRVALDMAAVAERRRSPSTKQEEPDGRGTKQTGGTEKLSRRPRRYSVTVMGKVSKDLTDALTVLRNVERLERGDEARARLLGLVSGRLVRAGADLRSIYGAEVRRREARGEAAPAVRPSRRGATREGKLATATEQAIVELEGAVRRLHEAEGIRTLSDGTGEELLLLASAHVSSAARVVGVAARSAARRASSGESGEIVGLPVTSGSELSDPQPDTGPPPARDRTPSEAARDGTGSREDGVGVGSGPPRGSLPAFRWARFVDWVRRYR
jgi:hypothetical protein